MVELSPINFETSPGIICERDICFDQFIYLMDVLNFRAS